ncbi:MAG: phosphoserine phosphatase [Deltaproteobacteria bacterium]|nr:phosphoserine phosphatase [Kofleriaceae bacterium]
MKAPPGQAPIAYLCRPADGEIASGDAVVVRAEPGATLVAVIDVLGHGHEAGKVAARAVRHLEAAPITRALTLMHGLHAELRGSRGAAVMLCVLRGFELDACGVGNVEARADDAGRRHERAAAADDARVDRFREQVGRLHRTDRLLCWSDGISTRLEPDSVRHLGPADACAQIMTLHRRRYDDASVVVADIGGIATA